MSLSYCETTPSDPHERAVDDLYNFVAWERRYEKARGVGSQVPGGVGQAAIDGFNDDPSDSAANDVGMLSPGEEPPVTGNYDPADTEIGTKSLI